MPWIRMLQIDEEAAVAHEGACFPLGGGEFEFPIRLDARGVDQVEVTIRGIVDQGPGRSFGEKPPERGTEQSRFARRLVAERRRRERLLGPELFGEPAWDTLLDLFIAGEEGRAVSVSSLCIAAAVPPTTALRWISVLTDKGKLIRRADPADRRRVYAELNPQLADDMRSLMTLWLRSAA